MIRHLVLASAFLATLPAPTTAQTVALTGGTVFTGTGARIENGTVLLRDGTIAAIGTNVAIPAGATRIDATGKWITPGLIHMAANAGLGVRGLGAFGETSQSGDVTAAFNVREGLDPDAIDIPITRTGGVTTGLLVPNGNFIAGQAVIANFSGSRMEEMVVRSPAVMVINLSSAARGAGGNSRAGVLARLRQIFADAREYEARRQDYGRAQMRELAASPADLEALLPVLRGELPVMMVANRASDIRSVIRLAEEFRLRVILRGGVEAWKVAPDLARAGIPVALNPMEDIPSFDGLGARLDNATVLREAGVEVLLAHQDSGGERNLRFGAGNAVRNGLTWNDALRSITLAPATVLGVASQYGSLETGKVANVVIWSGDPFEFSTVAEHVFIRGQDQSLHTRETELLNRYRTLPPKY